MRDTKDAITSKIAKVASLLPAKQLQACANANANARNQLLSQSRLAEQVLTTSSEGNSMMPNPENETQPSTSKSPSRPSQKRAATDVPSNADRIKRRRILEAVESAPTSSSKSPDVAVSLSV